jgi:formate dehydrogenase (coenzyme F420) beta subunit
MIDALRTTCRQLLDDGTVQVVIGYGRTPGDRAARPVFITRGEDADQLTWGPDCRHNLTTYLTRSEVKQLGRPAVVVKACDELAVTVLRRESQLEREGICVIGVVCDEAHRPRERACDTCAARSPRFADILIGSADSAGNSPRDRYADLEQFHQQSPDERLAFWREEFARCTKCYACRQVCPLCYCPRCIVDKNRPICIDPSPTLKGAFAWHITRAFHLAGRCVACDACTRACPAGIDLRLLNLSLARAAEEHFGYRAGEDCDAEPVIGAFREDDPESFIR